MRHSVPVGPAVCLNMASFKQNKAELKLTKVRPTVKLNSSMQPHA